MSRLSLHFLGSFQVVLDGKPISLFRSDKVRALLAYLSLESERSHRRDTLAGLLWPDMPDQLARKNLRLSLHRLRQTLDDLETEPALLQITREAVQFNLTDTWLDVAAFTEIFDEVESHQHPNLETCPTCVPQMEEAIELYRGDFLQGFYLDENLTFSEWVLLKRETLHRRTLWALHHLAAYYQRRGEHGRALNYAWRQLELEPWREEAHRQVMGILAKRGERSAALAQYEVCCQILAEELSAEPTEETTALYGRIRAVSAGRHNLPGQPTSFVGREEELAEVIRLLENPECRLLTIVGPGGIGKTRLALEAAAAKIDSFLEGIYFVPLAPVDSATFLVSAIADTLRFSFSGSQNPQLQLLNYLREKELLLILDNFEHLLEGTELLAEILQKSPKVKLLVSSRVRLNLSWEWRFEIGGLKFPTDEATDEYEPEDYSAMQLFQQAAKRVQKHFSLSENNKLAALRICHLVEGMPLGIELAAAWVGTHSCEEIAQEVGRNLSFLETSLQDVPERHRSLRATFEHSWNLLSPSEQQVFVKLSVFHRGFQQAAAMKIAGASRFVLKSLVDKSLLRFVPPGRYEIHELLRQYAAEKLAEMPEALATVRDRHCRYYMMFLRNRAADLIGTSAVEAQAAIKAEIENVRAAWHWGATQTRLERIEQGLNGLARYYLLMGPFQEGELLIRMAVNCVRELIDEYEGPQRDARTLLGRLLTEQARFLNGQSIYDQAINTIREAIDLAQGNQEVGLEAAGYLQWGQALLSQGKYDSARLRLEQALALSRVAPIRQVEVDSLRSLGVVCSDQGRYPNAKNYYKQALEIYREIGDSRGEAGSLRSLGLVSWFQGNDTKARDYLEQALAIFRVINDKHGMALQLHNLGRVDLEQGDYPHAREFFDQALHIFREIGDQQSESWALLNLGRVGLYQGNYPRAREFCDQALRVFREIHARQGEGLALINLGGISCQQGEYTEAGVLLDNALLICREIGDRQSESWALNYLAELALAQGDYSGAREYLKQTLHICREIGDRAGEGWGLANLGLLFHQLGDEEAALEYNQKAQFIGRELHHHPLQAATFTNLGHVLTALGNISEAINAYQKALALRRQLAQPHLTLEALAGLARVSLTQGKLAEALTQVDDILEYLSIDSPGHRLDGIDAPFQIYLTCYHVLIANHDPRACALINAAYDLLQERAAKITDTGRQRSFLEDVAAHREILDIWSGTAV